MNKIQKTILLMPEDIEKLRAIAEKEDRSVSSLVRLILKEYLRTKDLRKDDGNDK